MLKIFPVNFDNDTIVLEIKGSTLFSGNNFFKHLFSKTGLWPTNTTSFKFTVLLISNMSETIAFLWQFKLNLNYDVL